MRNKLFYNSISSTLNYCLTIIITLVISPLIVKTLGNRDYGFWELIMSVLGYMGLLDLGIGPALLRYVAVFYTNNDKEELQKTISTALFFFITIGLISTAILLALSSRPSIVFGKEDIQAGYLSTVFVFLAINTLVSFPLNVLIATILGVQRHYIVNTTRILFSLIRAIVLYYMLVKYPERGLITLALLETAFNIAQFAIYAAFLSRDPNIPAFSYSSCSFNKMQDLFTYGAKSAMLMISSRIQNTSLPFIISIVLGVSNIVYFTMPNRLVDYAKGLSLAIGFPLTPYFASQMAGDDKVAVKNSWLQTSLALQIITLSMPFFIVFCGESFLAVWIGKEYAVAGRGVLYCLAGALFVEAIAPNASRILMASGHHGRAALMWLILSIISVPLAVLGASRWGVTGVALGSATAMIIGNIVTLRMACRDVGATMAEYVRTTVVRLIMPLILLAALLWMTTKILAVTSYLQLALQVMICGLMYLIAVWFLTISKANKTQICEKIIMKFKKPVNPVA